MTSRGRRSRVVILGGGVAGISAAHELIERGFEVEVFERKTIAGGKARSVAAGAPGVDAPPLRSARSRQEARPLPAEHGFRFFPGFYKHVVDTMRRIPYRAGSVADNLTKTTQIEIASSDRPAYALPAEFPMSTGELSTDIAALLAVLSGRTGVTPEDTAFFATKVWQLLSSCEERRFVEYERVNWWDFIDAEARSAAYQTYFGHGITRSLVAAKARRASTKTIGDIFIQILLNIALPGTPADSLLNGPTNAVWIDPWLSYLRERGVVYHTDCDVRALHCHRGAIRSASIAHGSSLREVDADYFIAALPVERMAPLITLELLKLDPSLIQLNELTSYVEWMNGIQYYLTEDLAIAHGHVIYVDSPWALTSVSQLQFWSDFDIARCGDGAVRGILSVDISDWDVAGLNGKEARHCSRREIALETWEQLKKSLNVSGEMLSDRHLHSWFLDLDIDDTDADADPSTPRWDSNAEPLLVNYVDTWRLRPEACTRIPNLFLASDYVRTYTDLATMEAANEAARRAVNGILRASHSHAEACALWNLHEPELLLPLRAYDRRRFRAGLAWDGAGSRLASALLAREPAAISGERSHSATSAASARASSDTGLRRIRIVP
jgi:uncharacterized protein with NAD-binding domain and iron-sulfur cluster